MNLSGLQWFIIIALDLVLRAIYFVFSPYTILMIPFALFVSGLHLGILLLVSGCTRAFAHPSRAATIFILILTNVLFAFVFVGYWLGTIMSSQATLCFGPHLQDCYWIKGSITSLGIQNLARDVAIQIIINLAPILAILAFNARRASKRS